MLNGNTESRRVSSYCPWNLFGGSKEQGKKNVIEVLRPKFKGCVPGTHSTLKGLNTCVRDYKMNKLQTTIF